jgi:ribonuclease HII
LAGPVAVGVVAVPPGFDVLRELPGVKDSKQLNERKREAVYIEAMRFVSRGDIRYEVRFGSHGYIDRFGITRAVRKAAWEGIRALAAPDEAAVLLDGLLRAPKGYHQWTITRGDARVPVISLASILAKVERDRLMEEVSEHYPQYGFEQHKGYATYEHRKAINYFGLCEIHRKSFCKVGQRLVTGV